MEAKTLLTFLKRAKKFAEDNTYTSQLKVEGNITVEDMSDVLDTQIGGLIAGIYNDISEIRNTLVNHYEKTGNTKMADKFKNL